MQRSPGAVAIAAAQEAGAYLRANLAESAIVATKGKGDYVTGLDLGANDLIRSHIRAAFPDHRFFTEETANLPLGHEPTWIIDPIDGTLNIANGFPLFSVSVALVVDKRPVAGAVYDPLLDDLFAAEAGSGATWNGSSLDVADDVAWEDALLGFDLGHDECAAANSLALAAQLRPQVAGLRLIGSAALGMCFVAAGRLSGFFHHRLEPWDMAAALLLVQEARGRVATFDGKAVTAAQVGPVVCGQAKLVERICAGEAARLDAAGVAPT